MVQPRGFSIGAAVAMAALACACGTQPSRSGEKGEVPVRAASDDPARDAGPVSARLLADVSHVAPGQEFLLGLALDVDDGWYIHWTHPGDGGEGTRVSAQTPPGFAPEAPRFPGPDRIEADDGGVRFGYRESALVSIPVVASRSISETEIELSVEAEWMACRAGVCEHGRAAPRVALPVATPETPSRPAHRERFDGHRRRLPAALETADGIETSWQPAGKGRIELAIEVAGAADVSFFPERDLELIGHATTPADGGKALRLWLDSDAGGRAAGVIRLIRKGEVEYLRVDLEVPDRAGEATGF